MKKIAITLILISICSMASAAEITLTIPAEKVSQLKTSLFWYGTHQYGLEQDEEETDLGFVKRIIRHWVLANDTRYRQMIQDQETQEITIDELAID